MSRGFALPTVVLLLAAASLLTLLGVLPLADRLTGGGLVALAPALPYVLASGCLLGVVVSTVVPSPHEWKRAAQHRARQAQQLAARLDLSLRELEALLRHGCSVDEPARLVLEARGARTTVGRSAPGSDERCRTAHATAPALSGLQAADRAGGRCAQKLAAPAPPRSGTGAGCGSAAA